MSLLSHQLELLAPAKTAAIGREAILHGADAVYIGGPSFGARHNACNTVSEIAQLVAFAHRFHARIFVTLNTILHDAELEPARRLIHELYDAGVDALIVQDMGLLELDLPPIQLHASTQCDIRTPEKARFLADCGFDQLVLARELTLEKIRAVRAAVPADTTLEFFIHGALCVAYSGQCYISHAETGRSANRGDCSQACRLPYTLTDAQGRVVAFEKHLLSMKDNDQSANLEALVDAGIRSFKIEGRYKDMGYVKNITAHYRLLLDGLLDRRPEFARAASGRTEVFFTPDVDKNFHRGHTDYFVNGREGSDIGAFDSPKFIGVAIGTVSRVAADHFELETPYALANGDGLNYRYKREVIGLQANVATYLGQTVDDAGRQVGRWRVTPNEAMHALPGLKPGLTIHRNRDHAWEQALQKPSARRTIGVWLRLEDTDVGLSLKATDEDGITAMSSLAMTLTPAQQRERAEATLRDKLAALGNTEFHLLGLELATREVWFVPAGQLTVLRRDVLERLMAARLAAWVRPRRKPEVTPPVPYPETSLSYLANVYNAAARQFYTRHGVQMIAAAYEAHEEPGEVSLMITKHCLRFSFNLCPKQAKGVKGVQGQVKAEPMTLKTGSNTYTLRFDCKPCEMHVVGKMKPHIFQSAPPTSVPATATIQFFRQRP
jgi:putative protease